MHLIPAIKFKEMLRTGAATKSPIARLAPSIAPVITDDSRVVRFVFSDASVDRYGDTVDPNGWDTLSFMNNPIALFAHESDSIDTVVGKVVNLFVKNGQLIGDIEFMTEDVNVMAERVFKMVKGGFLNAVSVGFIPKEWEQSKDKSRPGGLNFKKQELLEISIVPIPANPNALIQARSLGLASDRRLKNMAELFPEVSPTGVTKGLFGVAMLAWLLEDLGWLVECAFDEAAIEGDDSAVPGMLLDAMKQLGQCLIAMTVEEVTELMEGQDTDVAADDADVMLMGMALTSKKSHPLATHLSRHFLAARSKAPLRTQKRHVVKVPHKLTKAAAEQMAAHYATWLKGPNKLLVLDDGVDIIELDMEVLPQDSSEVAPAGGTVPTGSCGLAPDQVCGMKEPENCCIHNSVNLGLKALLDVDRVIKAGRVLSNANESSLRQAAELISNVLTQVTAPEVEEDPGIQEAEFRARRVRAYEWQRFLAEIE